MPRAASTRPARPRRPSVAAKLRPSLEDFLAARRAWHTFVLPDVRVVGAEAFERAQAEDERLEREMRLKGYDAAFYAALVLGLDTALPPRPATVDPEHDRAARCDEPDGAGRSDAPDEPARRAHESMALTQGVQSDAALS